MLQFYAIQFYVILQCIDERFCELIRKPLVFQNSLDKREFLCHIFGKLLIPCKFLTVMDISFQCLLTLKHFHVKNFML
jgi:hypothetical protein